MGFFRDTNKKKELPELYSERHLECLENHIESHFGPYESVFHELVSPDIHVDIAIIPPSEAHNCYTLVTMRIGAHRMRVPKAVKKAKLDRAELVICLPPDWNMQSDEETDYWPLRWLKIMARLPGNEKSWLGWGHTVPSGEPFAENTRLCGMLLENPVTFGEEAAACPLPDGSCIRFYQMIPLYEEEMDYKVSHGTEALRGRFGGQFPTVVDIGRENVCEPLLAASL